MERESLLLAISGHAEGSSRTSALPPKADIQIMIPGQAPSDVRFAPNSGHSRHHDLAGVAHRSEEHTSELQSR